MKILCLYCRVDLASQLLSLLRLRCPVRDAGLADAYRVETLRPGAVQRQIRRAGSTQLQPGLRSQNSRPNLSVCQDAHRTVAGDGLQSRGKCQTKMPGQAKCSCRDAGCRASRKPLALISQLPAQCTYGRAQAGGIASWCAVAGCGPDPSPVVPVCAACRLSSRRATRVSAGMCW